MPTIRRAFSLALLLALSFVVMLGLALALVAHTSEVSSKEPKQTTDADYATPRPTPTRSPAPAEAPVVATPSPTTNPNYLLPDLQSLRVENAYIQYNEFDFNRELRFDTTVINMGRGPLEMAGAYESPDGGTIAVQRIRTADGAGTERIAGEFSFHPLHDHWHFEDFARIALWSYDASGDLAFELASTGKITFCAMDTYAYDLDLFGADQYSNFSDCSPEVQGISTGWADTYDPSVPGQQLDLTDIPDGRFALLTEADPANHVLETSELNNASITYIEISGEDVSILPGP